MIRSSSFGPTSSSQPPAKQPFSFGGSSSSTNNNNSQQPSSTAMAPSNNTFSFGSGNAGQQSTNTAPVTGGFSFGGASSSAQQQQPQNAAPSSSTSLFGAKPAGSTGGFSFGQPSSNNNNNQQGQSSTLGGGGGGLSGSLFGSNSNTNTGSGLFGASTNNAATGNNSNTTGTGLFGNNNAGSTGTGTGLFGSSTGGFGSSTGGFGSNAGTFGSTLAPNTGTGLFGQPAATSATTAPMPGSSLFGNSLGIGSSTAFSQPQQPQQQAQQQLAQQSPFSRHTYYQRERFNDLPEDARKMVEEMDKLVSSQVRLRDDLTPKLIPSSGSALASLGTDIQSLYSTLHQASLSLNGLGASMDHEFEHARGIAAAIETDRRDFAVLWEVGANYREGLMRDGGGAALGLSQVGGQQGFGAGPHDQQQQGQQGQQQQQLQSSQQQQADNKLQLSTSTSSTTGGEKHRDFLRSYLDRLANDFHSRLTLYRSRLDTIHHHLQSLSAGAGGEDHLSARERHSPQAISDTIYFQHAQFMRLASDVAGLHSEVDVLKRDYRQWWAKRFRSARDPFELASLSDGLSTSAGIGIGMETV
ncbi:unnamed protein product [Jaminaea pallidilutea]